MIASEKILASSLELEPNRDVVLRDLHRASRLGKRQILVNENMLGIAAAEVREASLDLNVSAVVGFPIGQWFWPMKETALRELADEQSGPVVVMHSIGSWLDRSDAAKAERSGILAIKGNKWLMTSLSLIPDDRVGELADDVAAMGVKNLILSNGVTASKIDPPDADGIRAMSKAAAGRFGIIARPEKGADEAAAQAALDAGADVICSDDFWELAH